MKKALLGTTALVAAGLVAQNAHAADPISLSVGGYQSWGVYIADYDDDEGVDSTGIRGDGEIHFKGKTVLDNGLEVGVRFELEHEQADDQMDETYVWVEGSFGTLRVGNDDAASYQMSTAAPYASYVWGLNTATFSIGGVTTLSTFAGVGVGDSASLMYFTPVFNGFQFGLSYAPEAGTEAQDIDRNPEGGDAWSAGARYDGAVAGVGLTVAAGFTTQDIPAETTETAAVAYKPGVWRQGTNGNAQIYSLFQPASGYSGDVAAGTPIIGADEDTASPTALDANALSNIITPAIPAAAASTKIDPGRTVTDWNIGMVLTFDELSVGGSYRTLDEDQNNDKTFYDLGARYSEGPWAISLVMGHAESDVAGTGEGAYEMDDDFYRLTAAYDLGPGVKVVGAVGMNQPNKENADSSFIATALSLSF